VASRDAFALEAEERPGDVEEPTVLHRVVDTVEMFQKRPHPVPRFDVRSEARLRHPGGMSKLSVVVVVEDVVETASGGVMRVDVRMRVDQWNLAKGAIQILCQCVVCHGD